MKPLAIDLFCGMFGWSEGFAAEGWRTIGFDIEDMCGQFGVPRPDHCQLVIQNVLTVHGGQLKDAHCIVASPVCTEFSYMAMPFGRGKQIARALRGEDDFPPGYRGSRTIADLTRLVDTCFRIQREASDAAGHHIPMIMENVLGAIPWIGRSKAHYGSFHFWGDVPALMPIAERVAKVPGMGAGWVGPEHPKHRPGLAFNPAAQGARVREELAAAADGLKVPGFRFDGSGRSFQTASVEGMKHDGSGWRENGCLVSSNRMVPSHVPEGLKHGGDWFSDPSSPSRQGGQVKAVAEGRKGAGAGAEWFDGNLCVKSSKSPARKRASAMIARIPEPLSRWIARTYYPRSAP